MNREEIKIKCLELAVDYMNHLKHFHDCRYTEEKNIVAIAKKFESYVTGEEKED